MLFKLTRLTYLSIQIKQFIFRACLCTVYCFGVSPPTGKGFSFYRKKSIRILASVARNVHVFVKLSLVTQKVSVKKIKTVVENYLLTQTFYTPDKFINNNISDLIMI